MANQVKPVLIHGKEYMPVAGRVLEAHKKNPKALSITTELVNNNPVVFKATVICAQGTFTGYSAVSWKSEKMIEKSNPYEVAETSAVGRALGFAGYGVIDGIASADEMHKASMTAQDAPQSTIYPKTDNDTAPATKTCEKCGKPATEKRGQTAGGKEWHGIFCTSGEKSHTRWLWN